jgi:hypothetical protein
MLLRVLQALLDLLAAFCGHLKRSPQKGEIAPRYLINFPLDFPGVERLHPPVVDQLLPVGIFSHAVILHFPYLPRS